MKFFDQNRIVLNIQQFLSPFGERIELLMPQHAAHEESDFVLPDRQNCDAMAAMRLVALVEAQVAGEKRGLVQRVQ